MKSHTKSSKSEQDGKFQGENIWVLEISPCNDLLLCFLLTERERKVELKLVLASRREITMWVLVEWRKKLVIAMELVDGGLKIEGEDMEELTKEVW